MPSFTTPGPAALHIQFTSGRLHVQLEDRDTAEIDVAPNNPSNAADVEHATSTVVEQRGDQIVVVAPTTKRWFGRCPKLNVRVIAPTRSDASIQVESADVRLVGLAGALDVRSASGDIRFDDATSLTASTASGDVVGVCIGRQAKLKSASGDLHIGALGGDGDLTTASGDINVGAVGGNAQCRSASGDVSLGPIDGSASAKTASGDIRLESVRSGTVEIDSASGDILIGVAGGTAAWLDVQSLSGDITSELEGADAPDEDAPTVTIRGRTLSGDVAIRRGGGR